MLASLRQLVGLVHQILEQPFQVLDRIPFVVAIEIGKSMLHVAKGAQQQTHQCACLFDVIEKNFGFLLSEDIEPLFELPNMVLCRALLLTNKKWIGVRVYHLISGFLCGRKEGRVAQGEEIRHPEPSRE
jgi:hypothetical protein